MYYKIILSRKIIDHHLAKNQWDTFGNSIRATTKDFGDALLVLSGGLAKGLNVILDFVGETDNLKEAFDQERVTLLK